MGRGREVSILQGSVPAWYFPTHASSHLLAHGQCSLCLNSGDWSVPSFFWTKFGSPHSQNLWEVCLSKMWVRISRHTPLSHNLLEKDTKNGKKARSNVHHHINWELCHKDISVLPVQKDSVVPADNNNRDGKYSICGRPSAGHQWVSDTYLPKESSINLWVGWRALNDHNSETSSEGISWFHSDNIVYFLSFQ